jgi:hypothetical protein
MELLLFTEPDSSLPDVPFVSFFPKDDKLQYQLSVEKNDASKMTTIQYDQYYDGPGNRAVTIIRDSSRTAGNEEVKVYVNGNQNERYTYVPAGG